MFSSSLAQKALAEEYCRKEQVYGGCACDISDHDCILPNKCPVQSLTSLGIAGIIMLKLTAYLIFRASNSQKNQFRRDRNHPSVSQLKTLKTERGTELIISGWWGISRHINYFGDWLLA